MPGLGIIPNDYERIGLGEGPTGAKLRHQARFLAAFAACGSVTQASRWAKCGRTAHYDWMAKDTDYPARFRQAEAKAARALEDEAVRRAREGLRKPVLFKGKPVFVGGQMLYETEYSDTLMVMLLKGNNPSKYKDRVENTHVWDGNLQSLSDAQIEQLERSLAERYGQQQLPASVIETTAEVVETKQDVESK